MTFTFAYLLCPIILPNISKRSLEWIMILKVAKILANLVPNYPFTPKQIFSGKLTNITFAYLLSSIIQQRLKQILRANHYIQGCIILSQIGSKLPIFPKHSVQPSPPPLSAGRGRGWTSFQIFKKGGLIGPQLWEEVTGQEEGNGGGGIQFLRGVDTMMHPMTSCIVLAQIEPKLPFPPKGTFLENLTNIKH